VDTRMRRRKLLKAVPVASMPVVAGCFGGGGDEGTPEPNETFTLENRAVDPLTLSIDSGETVAWQNEDNQVHHIVSRQFHDSAASWDFGRDVSTQLQVTHTFEEAGIYEFACEIHGQQRMCGAVLVGDVSLDASLPCE